MKEHSPDLITRLRVLRGDANRLRASLARDLRAFRKEDYSFFTLPDSKPEGISVATTCTAVMALLGSNQAFLLFREENEDTETAKKRANGRIKKLFSSVVKTSWRSSDLEDLNAFTTSMVIRATGFLVKAGVLSPAEARDLKHKRPRIKVRFDRKNPPGAIGKTLATQKEPTLERVVNAVVKSVPNSFRIPKYPPKMAMAYWFIDGVTKAGFAISPEYWKKIAKWATHQFNRELSYVVSGNDALMDPSSLAMAACVVKRTKKICAENESLSDIGKALPSSVELTHAVLAVFEKQTPSGIWNRHFPLFHFPGSGAADYCFSFEFLEAILIEFYGSDILGDARILEHIIRTVRWCDNNRLEFASRNEIYRGWNAGGDVTNLVAGMPESWATATVHMFLAELDSAIAAHLDKLVLKRYQLDRDTVVRSEESWKSVIDVDVTFPGEKPTTMKTVMEEALLATERMKFDAKTLRERRLTGSRSALLFGPPGNSKTNIARGIAEWLGWPLLVITPSDFLSKGLEQIYVRVHEVFEDLMDISAAVVLFDEMDALAQTRGAGESDLDVTRQLLTTSMLPKLANLWNHARVIFIMATNHKQQLDAAITRPGRFDLLICVGPPAWTKKLEGLKVVLKNNPPDDLPKVQKALKSLTQSKGTHCQLDNFTVPELGSFLEHLRRRQNTPHLLTGLRNTTQSDFDRIVGEWATTTIALADRALANEYESDRRACRRQ